jgi:hypothetical protein
MQRDQIGKEARLLYRAIPTKGNSIAGSMQL